MLAYILSPSLGIGMNKQSTRSQFGLVQDHKKQVLPVRRGCQILSPAKNKVNPIQKWTPKWTHTHSHHMVQRGGTRMNLPREVSFKIHCLSVSSQEWCGVPYWKSANNANRFAKSCSGGSRRVRKQVNQNSLVPVCDDHLACGPPFPPSLPLFSHSWICFLVVQFAELLQRVT